MREKPILVIDHLSTTRVQVNGKFFHRHCFVWRNRQNGGEVKLMIELLDGTGRVQHSCWVSISPLRRISNQQIIIDEVEKAMPAQFRCRTGQGWSVSQSATGELLGSYADAVGSESEATGNCLTDSGS